MKINKYLGKLFQPKQKSKVIELEIPKDFYNCGISVWNYFIADTNDSQNWQTIKFPLPEPFGEKWEILEYANSKNNKIVKLISYK